MSEQGYHSDQHTRCAVCGIDKHTPLRRDEIGGYVCLTCIDKMLDELSALKSQRDELLAALKEISLADTIAHSTGKYSLVVESCAESARAAIANAEATP